MWRRGILVCLIAPLLVFLGFQFAPPPAWDALPTDYTGRTAGWVSVEWTMEAHTSEEIETWFAPRQMDDLWIYTSYLKADDTFNQTYDHAIDLNRELETLLPNTRRLAWIGVPISVTEPDGFFNQNRLNDPAIRQQIADFCAFAVETLGFDGIHLNAELIPEGDPAYLLTLEAIRAALPPDAFLSTTAHALRQTHSVTFTPYPIMAHHASVPYLQEIAKRVDQIGLMAYDSGLSFARDYRLWAAYQTQTASEALAGSDVELFIGLPVSLEWSGSHQTQAEYLGNALAGFRSGIAASASPQSITGIAIYPDWEMSTSQWDEVRRALGKFDTTSS